MRNHLNHPDVTRELSDSGEEHIYVNGRLAFRMFGLFAAVYVLSYAFRAVNAVLAEPLTKELGLSSADLGLLASGFFLTFALMQLPVGVLLDRYGPRRTEVALLGLAALGAIIFASAQSFEWLWIGRALIGVGVSACLMAAVKAYSLYFRPHMQASMSSWMLMAGSLGALAVTTPVEAAIPLIGWRGVFYLMAFLCVVAMVVLWFALPVLFSPQKTESWPVMARGYREVFASRHFWRVAPLATITQGGFIAFQGLWIGPWFTRVVGQTNAQAAQSMFWVALVLMAGYFLLGVFTRRVARAKGNEDQIMSVGLGLTLLLTAWQVWAGEESTLWVWLIHALLLSSGIMTYSICNRPFPKRLTGRSSTALNLLIFVGAFLIQWGIGLGIDGFMWAGLAEPDAFRATMGVLLFLMGGSWIWFNYEPKP
ncbi:MAG: MFS transporter [Limnobacter sp.]|nr:MFS transporter [Limnobacter sp.]